MDIIRLFIFMESFFEYYRDDNLGRCGQINNRLDHALTEIITS